MEIKILILLTLLQIKHYYFDYVGQSKIELENKDTLFSSGSIIHALKHQLGTFVALSIVFPITSLLTLAWIFLISYVDFILHNFIDTYKNAFVKEFQLTPKDKNYWSLFGADQLLHNLTYILIILIALWIL
jgi:hypothetical protein